jgi:potassium efflux system protein
MPLLFLLFVTVWLADPSYSQSPSQSTTASGTALFSQEAVAASSTRLEPQLKRALIESKIKEVESSGTLDENTAKRLIERYRQTLSHLEETRVYEERANTYRQALEHAPQEIQELQRSRQELLEAAVPQRSEALPDITLEQIEQQLVQQLVEIASTEAIVEELNKIFETNALAPNRARKRLAEANLALGHVNAELAAEPEPALTPLEAQARQWALETRRDNLRAELLMLDQQILSAGVRTELNLARRALAEEKLKQLRERRAGLENQADRLRRLETEQVQQETAAAVRDLSNAHPLVRELARDNTGFGQTLGELTARLDQLDETQAEVKDRRSRIEDEYRSARQRLETAGLSRALGQALVTQFYRLPDLHELRTQTAEYADQIAEANLNLVRYRDLLSYDQSMSARIQNAITTVPPADRPELKARLDEQLEHRNQLLRRLIVMEDSTLRGVTELDDDTQALMRVVQDYRDFLRQRLLWVRSVVPITEQSFADLPAALTWLTAPANWQPLPGVLLRALQTNPLSWVGLALALLLLGQGAALRQHIRRAGEPLRRVSSDRFGYTLKALSFTLLLALPWPLLLTLTGWCLDVSVAATPFSKAIGAALTSVGIGLYYLRAFHLLCLSGGVADRHFRWSTAILDPIRQNFAWATLVLPPLGLVAGTFVIHPDPGFSGTLGRLSMLALILAFTAFTVRLIDLRHGVFAATLSAHPQHWFSRLRIFWYSALLAVPIFLAGLTLNGYLYTSGMLIEALISELWLILALVVIHQLIVRWLIVTRRGLALKAALEKHVNRDDDATNNAGITDTPAEDSVDLAALDEQTRRLINSMIVIAGAMGLWLIWSEVLPALSLLDHITLWDYSSTVDGVETLIPVTLADIGLLMLIVLAVIIAARNLPALLEIILLRHTEISPGMRYTVTTLTGYVITALGMLLVFGALGLSWGQIQWLIAALSLGIGFGLQEIVANFISGLIILFERPIRVGDVVTIGDTTGEVTRIQIRATTIRNWDKQELLVPNKEFITGRLLNWTLSDKINRLTIEVGVAHGSDTRKALALLVEVATKNPRVLDDPEPLVTFERFGDSALTLVLRCYLGALDYRLTVISELSQAIDDKFRAAGIRIAFPQRDVHLYARDPILPEPQT